MKCEQFLNNLNSWYKLINVLSNKNGTLVLRMRHIELDHDIIVKRYSDVVRAYELLKDIRHENLPEILDSVVCEDGHIVLEEYIDGISVADVAGRYTYKGARAVIVGVCRAVHSLHERKIVHRDIKPENIMISSDGIVIRIPAESISRFARPSKGVRVMRVKDGERIITLSLAEKEEIVEDEAEEQTEQVEQPLSEQSVEEQE